MSKLVIAHIFLLFGFCIVLSQTEAPKRKLPPIQQDTLSTQVPKPILQEIPQDTVVSKDTTTSTSEISKHKKTSAIDEIIKLNARDSIRFEINRKFLRLSGKSKVEYKNQKLESEIIEFYLDNSLLVAQGMRNAYGQLFGYPIFTDNKETYFGEKISYNFRTKQGTITLGETQIGEGYYFGQKLKKVDEDEFFVEGGCYTTCNAPHPHYYFGSPRMKVIPGDKVFVDPLIFYVEDLPIFILPIGLYFPNRSGRQSGLIVPSFFFSQRRGVTIENLGLYLALSDYYDTRFSANFYSKGGVLVKNFTQWKYRNELEGSLDVSYGRVRMTVDEPYQQTWGLQVRHNHRLNPFESYNAEVSFYSKDFFRQTSTDLLVRQTLDLNSRASYNRTFENGSSVSLGYFRSQNIVTQEYTESPTLQYSIPQFNPFSFSNNSFLRGITLQYSFGANYSKSKRLRDTTFLFSHSSKLSHNPVLNFPLPKLGYFNLTPFFSFSLNNYFRKITKVFDPTDSTVRETITNGFFGEYNYRLGLNLSTKLYGIVKPKLFGINALRHTLSPSLQYSYSPDLSAEKFGFYGKYFDLKQNREVIYSRYELDGGGIASKTLTQQISFNIQNQFSAKVFVSDTSDDKTVDFLNFSVSGYYNFAADSLRLSDLSFSVYTPSIPKLNVNANFVITPYDEDPILDAEGRPTSSFRKVNRFLLSEGKGFGRLTSFSLNLSTNFGGGEFPKTFASTEDNPDSLSLGERFSLRTANAPEDFDFWGDKTFGNQPFNARWNLSLDASYRYHSPTRNQRTSTLEIGFTLGLQLTKTWTINLSGQIDAIKKQILSPIVRINKDLHCWDLTFIWYPTGFNQGYYFRFGIKSSVLKDLKIEKRSSPIY